MHYDLIGLSRVFSNWQRSGKYLVSIDFKQFDAHRSNIDLLHIKTLLGHKTSMFNEHMKYESYCYPLLFGVDKQIILDRADRLMSGDYLTSFYGTF